MTGEIWLTASVKNGQWLCGLGCNSKKVVGGPKYFFSTVYSILNQGKQTENLTSKWQRIGFHRSADTKSIHKKSFNAKQHCTTCYTLDIHISNSFNVYILVQHIRSISSTGYQSIVAMVLHYSFSVALVLFWDHNCKLSNLPGQSSHLCVTKAVQYCISFSLNTLQILFFTLIHAFIASSLHDFNGLLTGLPQRSIK